MKKTMLSLMGLLLTLAMIFSFAGCAEPPVEENYIGNWKSTYDENFSITEKEFIKKAFPGIGFDNEYVSTILESKTTDAGTILYVKLSFALEYVGSDFKAQESATKKNKIIPVAIKKSADVNACEISVGDVAIYYADDLDSAKEKCPDIEKYITDGNIFSVCTKLTK